MLFILKNFGLPTYCWILCWNNANKLINKDIANGERVGNIGKARKSKSSKKSFRSKWYVEEIKYRWKSQRIDKDLDHVFVNNIAAKKETVKDEDIVYSCADVNLDEY